MCTGNEDRFFSGDGSLIDDLAVLSSLFYKERNGVGRAVGTHLVFAFSDIQILQSAITFTSNNPVPACSLENRGNRYCTVNVPLIPTAVYLQPLLETLPAKQLCNSALQSCSTTWLYSSAIQQLCSVVTVPVPGTPPCSISMAFIRTASLPSGVQRLESKTTVSHHLVICQCLHW